MVNLDQFRGKRALTYAEFVSAIRAAMPGLTRKMRPFVASYGDSHAAGVCGLSVRYIAGKWHVEQYQGDELPFVLDAALAYFDQDGDPFAGVIRKLTTPRKKRVPVLRVRRDGSIEVDDA